ncbi:MAG: ATP-binding protein [Ktedonobacterales bacterium]
MATTILVGIFSGVLIAAITPLAIYGIHAITVRRGYRTFSGAARQAAINAALILLVGASYVSTPPLLIHILPPHLYAHVVAASLATIIALCGVLVLQALRWQWQMDQGEYAVDVTSGVRQSSHVRQSWGASIRQYLGHKAFRYQVLLFSIGPLFPFVEVLDDTSAELAWLVFLIPLCGIYYLAVQSVQLQQKSTQLEQTVTELRASRLRAAELQGYAALVTQAQEDERRRLARDLHDDTAQTLVALARGLDAFAPAVALLPPQSARPPHPLQDVAQMQASAADSLDGAAPGAPGAPGAPDDTADNTRYLEELRNLTRRALESVRRACQDLRPSVLDDLGLPSALESLATLTTRRGLSCAFEQHGAAQVYASPAEVAVYRIAQEALTNVRRHSYATQATISLTYEAAALQLTVRDNGVGFDLATAAPLATEDATETSAPQTGLGLPGLGLLGMRERAALIGGAIEIASKPGGGASVTLTVPATTATEV